MKSNLYSIILGLLVVACSPNSTKKSITNNLIDGFPKELVSFKSYENNPVFNATGVDTWDRLIRERGWILKEDSLYYMWYTGYQAEGETHYLGLATSPDGINWTRFPGNPIYESNWVEDMCVVKLDGTYYMFAEGVGDTAHLLISTNRINWEDRGPLDIRYTDGKPLTKGSYGTPSVIYENGIWYLFYEREDLAIWLATSTDLKVWTNKQDDPVYKMGLQAYDKYAIAFNQVFKYKGIYYAYTHATEFEDWHEWTSNIAKSTDLVHWENYAGNPILRENKSSALLVNMGEEFWLYSMHSEVCIHKPVN
jgi:predicted GH43/DUF377 family glycosyl hydrolase